MRDVEIRPVDPSNLPEMQALQDAYERAVRAEQPDAVVYTLEDAVAILRREPVESFTQMFGAFSPSGEVLGQSLVTGRLVDNTQTATLWVWVAPEHGRQGLGSALVHHAEEHLSSLGRTVLQTDAWLGVDGESGYRPFAERHGYALANTQVERRLPLPVDSTMLDRLAAEAAERHRDYRVFAVDGPIPDELLQPYCDLYNHLLVEMPTGDLEVERTRKTPEAVREQDAWLADSGRVRVSAFAQAPDGSLAAGTTLHRPVDPSSTDPTYQWWTLVHPDHRGHRLGQAVKAAAHRELARRHTSSPFVRTVNAETNSHMVAINEALGYVKHAVEGEFQKRLTP